MKVTREQAAANRERILDTAARLFRERGFAGIGVADLMKEAGLTHGGFYGHFASKEDLMVQACERAAAQKLAQWQTMIDTSPRALAKISRAYLSPQHRDAPGNGCVLAALAADASREGPAVRHAVTAGLKAQIDVLAPLMRGPTAAARHQQALATYAALVGAMVLARVSDDEALSKDVLAAASSIVALVAATSN